MELRFGKRSDFEQVNRLARQVHDLHVAWRPDVYRNVSHPISEEWMAQLLETKSLIVAESGEELTGYLVYFIQSIEARATHVQRKVMKIEALCVDEGSRRQGIAKQLMNHAIALGRSEGCTELQLTCASQNKDGIAFYESLGMTPQILQFQSKL